MTVSTFRRLSTADLQTWRNAGRLALVAIREMQATWTDDELIRGFGLRASPDEDALTTADQHDREQAPQGGREGDRLERIKATVICLLDRIDVVTAEFAACTVLRETADQLATELQHLYMLQTPEQQEQRPDILALLERYRDLRRPADGGERG